MTAMTDRFDPYYTWLGIPPEEQPADKYRLLGLRRFESNRDAISNAADQRMAHVRTFQSGKHADVSQKLLNEIARAAASLLNPAEKVTYDRRLQASLNSAPAANESASGPSAGDADEATKDTKEVPQAIAMQARQLSTAKPLTRRASGESRWATAGPEEIESSAAGKLQSPPSSEPPGRTPLRGIEKPLTQPANSPLAQPPVPSSAQSPPPLAEPPFPQITVGSSHRSSSSAAVPPVVESATASSPDRRNDLASTATRRDSSRGLPAAMVVAGIGATVVAIVLLAVLAFNAVSGSRTAEIASTPIGQDEMRHDRVAAPFPTESISNHAATDFGGEANNAGGESPVGIDFGSNVFSGAAESNHNGGAQPGDGLVGGVAPSDSSAVPVLSTTPMNSGATSATTPPGDLEGADAIRLRASDSLELTDSRSRLDWVRPFTVEMWMRPLAGHERHWLIGDLAFIRLPSSSAAVTSGWQWWIEPNAAGRWRIAVSSARGFFVETDAPAAGWHHLALCSDADQLSLYLDGQFVGSQPLELLRGEWRESPLNLHVGSHPQMAPQQQGGMNADVRWLRISSASRYSTNFTPARDFAPDSETQALLDMSQINGGRVGNLAASADAAETELPSGRMGEGIARGGTRLVAGDFALPAEAVGAAPASTLPGSINSNPSESKPLAPIGDAPMTSRDLTAANNDAAGPTPNDTVAANRIAVPSREELADAQQKIDDVFSAESLAADSPEEKAAVAEKMAATARESVNDRPAQYALLERAKKLAMEAGRIALAMSIIDEMESTFDVDGLQSKLDALKQAGGKPSVDGADSKSLIEASLNIVEQSVLAGEFKAAEEAARIGYAAATRSKDNGLKLLARARRDELPTLERNWKSARAAEKELEAAPEDASRRLIWGRFLALQQRDWAAAAPSLALANDGVWREIGEAESSPPEDAAGSQSLADKLWKAAESTSRRERESLLLRARHWYSKARLVGAQGLDLAHVENRLAEIDSQLPFDLAARVGSPATIAAPAGAAPPFADIPAARHGLLGRIANQGADAGMLLRYQDSFVIADDKVTELFMNVGIPRGAALRIELAGLLHVPEAMTVNVRQVGGSDTGRHTLSLNGRTLGEVGGENRATSDVYKVDLAAGEYAVRWSLTGGDIGSSAIQFTNAETGDPLVLHHTAAMLAALRAAPTRLNVDMVK